MRIICFSFLLLLWLPVISQDLSQRVLEKLDDEELLKLFDEVLNDSTEAETVARVYLKRAKYEKDTIKMARGYDRLARIFHPEKNIHYADSVINISKSLSHITYPALGYILKGYCYEILNSKENEFKNYLKAYSIAIKNDNISQQLYVLDKLISIKSIWGNKEDALKFQQKRHKIIYEKDFNKKLEKSTRISARKDFTNLHKVFEISSLQNYSICYLNLKKIDSAMHYSKVGLIESKRIDDNLTKYNFEIFFKEIIVEIEFYSKNYKGSIEKIDSILMSIENKSFKRLQNLYLFKGLSLLELGDKSKGIYYLKKSDSIFENNNLIISQPYQRILFEKLLEYHSKNNNIEQKIFYLNKLISADSIIKKNYKYFEPELIKNFETPNLIKEKEQLIESLKEKNKTSTTTTIWVIVLLSITLLALGYNIKKRKNYKRRFDQLMLNSENNKPQTQKTRNNQNEISKDIIEDILNRLDQFEDGKGYLSQDVSLMGLAKSFGTNYKYLSKIINLNKAKRFSSYINDMRVEFVFNELKNNFKFRRYTIKAIAAECGFNNPDSFNKAFYKVYSIYPSYYIKQLENKKNVN